MKSKRPTMLIVPEESSSQMINRYLSIPSPTKSVSKNEESPVSASTASLNSPEDKSKSEISPISTSFNSKIDDQYKELIDRTVRIEVNQSCFVLKLDLVSLKNKEAEKHLDFTALKNHDGFGMTELSGFFGYLGELCTNQLIENNLDTITRSTVYNLAIIDNLIELAANSSDAEAENLQVTMELVDGRDVKIVIADDGPGKPANPENKRGRQQAGGAGVALTNLQFKLTEAGGSFATGNEGLENKNGTKGFAVTLTSYPLKTLESESRANHLPRL